MYDPSAPAAVICSRFEMSEEARQLLSDDPVAGRLLQRLSDAKLHRDAIRLLARLLDKRRAVWWGCLVIEHLTPPPEGCERVALGTAVRWVLRPGAQSRQDAESAGRPATLNTAGGAIALAAY